MTHWKSATNVNSTQIAAGKLIGSHLSLQERVTSSSHHVRRFKSRTRSSTDHSARQKKRTTYIKLTADDKISQMQKNPSCQVYSLFWEKGALVDREGFCSGCLDVCNPLLAHICSPKSRRSSSHPGCFSWTPYSLL